MIWFGGGGGVFAGAFADALAAAPGFGVATDCADTGGVSSGAVLRPNIDQVTVSF